MKDQFFEKLREILEAEDKEIALEDKFRDYDEWDSLANRSLIATIDDEYGVVIPNDEFKKIETVGELIQAIQAKMAS
jgi:acyl carrier protein